MNDRKPRLQNIPIRTELGRELREAFYPTPCALIEVDYAALELSVFAAALSSPAPATPPASPPAPSSPAAPPARPR